MQEAFLYGLSVSQRVVNVDDFAKLERLTPIDRALVLKSGTGRREAFSYRSHVFGDRFGFRNRCAQGAEDGGTEASLGGD
jgi:hypothetical protein